MGPIAMFGMGLGGLIVIMIAYFGIKSLTNYIKVAPNEVIVVYGRNYKWEDGTRKGYKMVTGGAVYVIPLLEKYQRLPLDAFQIKHSVKSVPSEQGVRVTVNAVASLKIGRTQEDLEASVTRFLGRDLNEIGNFAQEVIEGGLRGVVATMTVEQLVKERTSFGNKVQEQITNDLSRLGFLLDNFLIQDISDEMGYIDALGQKQTANVKRDAAIGVADAKRDETIQVAEAHKEADQKASAARKMGETAKANAAQEISDAERERDIIIAQNKAKVEAEQAKIKIIADIAAAKENEKLNVAKVAAEKSEIEARIELEQKEAVRKNEELIADEIVPAKRKKEATIITAEGLREAEIIKAEGKKKATELQAEGDKLKEVFESEGRKATATAKQVEMEAEAAGRKASLEAEAAGTRAQLVAEAAGARARLEAEATGIKAKLEAEASGIEKKAEAYAKLDKVGKFLELLDRVPTIIETTGKAIKEAGEGTLAPMSQAIGTGIANIDEIKIIDLGGGKGEGGDALNRITEIVPRAVFNLLHTSSALGLQGILKEVSEKVGVSPESLKQALGEAAGGELPEFLSSLAKSSDLSSDEKEDSDNVIDITDIRSPNEEGDE